ncbi:hypothetical protein PZ938_03005 [Luteipulveratus sp. YIM 133132]|uniref:hypothetical protein n=1 Tax=Luteipulveratus flavus TaxID=3031728 RepID=UPI0023B1F89F|nr:hypothetical protein [Luteipulveratus sp. YIM 133132]MDE9364561.1 hypothetical protein [Luteipulveratus sp. YIM 133132]
MTDTQTPVLAAYCRTHGVSLAECKCPPPPAGRCPECGGVGSHGYVHQRYGNGAGGNRPCSQTPFEVQD